MKTVTVNTTAGGVELAPAGNRAFIHLYNAGSVTAYLKYDGDATALTTSNGMPLPAGATLHLNNDAGGKAPFIHEVRGITASGSTDIRVQGED